MKIVTLTGMTCSGKSTLETALLALDNKRIGKIISHTTRKPRIGEIEGVDYHFVGRDFFTSNYDSFVESVEFDGSLYGAHEAELNRLRDSGVEVVVFVAEPNGVHQIKDYCFNTGIEFYPFFLDIPMATIYYRVLKRFNMEEHVDVAQITRYAKRLDTMNSVEIGWRDQWERSVLNTSRGDFRDNALRLVGVHAVSGQVERVLKHIHFLKE